MTNVSHLDGLIDLLVEAVLRESTQERARSVGSPARAKNDEKKMGGNRHVPAARQRRRRP